MRRQDGRNLITTGDRLTEMTRACQSGRRASSSGGMTRWALSPSPRVPHSLETSSRVAVSWMPGRKIFVPAVDQTVAAPCSPYLSRSCPVECTTAATWMPFPAESASQAGRSTGHRCSSSRANSRPGVELAVRLGQAVVAGGAVHVGGEAAEQRRARGAVPAGGEHVDGAAVVGERADVERPGGRAGDHGADFRDGQPGQGLAHGQPDGVGGLAGPVELGEAAEQFQGRGGVLAGVVDRAGAVPVGPRPHVAHVPADQRGGVHAGGQGGGGLLHPPGHLPHVRDGSDQVGGAADGLGRVLAPDRHAPPERGRDAGDVLGVEHLDGAEPGAVAGGGRVDVGPGFGDQGRAGVVDDPVGEHPGFPRPGQGQDEGLVLGAGEDPAEVLGAAEPDGVLGGPGGEAVVQPHRGPGPAAVAQRREPRPADGQLGEAWRTRARGAAGR